MTQNELLAREFEATRPHLRAVAYRMLGSLNEADDAVQEAWLRLTRSESDEIDNLGGWLTTVVARISLDMLRSRRSRREEPIPEPIVDRADGLEPEHEALLADSVGLALLVVLETLSPAERLAFVLHDMFAVPFDEIGAMVDRSPEAARQLASRARRRVQGSPTEPDPDLARQREVVDAFFAAAREGDFDALVAVLHPEVVVRSDRDERRGAEAVASQAMRFAHLAPYVRPALVNGAAGVVVVPPTGPFAVMAFTVADGKVVAIDAIAGRERLSRLDLRTFLT